MKTVTYKSEQSGGETITERKCPGFAPGLSDGGHSNCFRIESVGEPDQQFPLNRFPKDPGYPVPEPVAAVVFQGCSR